MPSETRGIAGFPSQSGQNLATAYADLSQVVAAWPTLPDAIRRAVLAIVTTATPAPTGGTLRQLDDSAPAGYETGKAGG